MTLLAPGFLFAAIAVAVGIVSLHFIVIRPPRSAVLPTARFVPETRATTVASARRPSDLLLMLLRMLTVLAVGAALAKPIVQPARRATATVLLVDVSRSVSDASAIRDSVRGLYRDGDALVLFDSAARVIDGSAGDSVSSITATSRRGNLSAALIGALRAGSGLRERADSLRLIIVSPFATEEFDEATDSIRRLWHGRATLVRAGVSARALPATAPSVNWPTGQPFGTVARTRIDSVGGVMAGDARVVAPFERRWSYPPDSLRGAEVIARWVDGEPAAIERPRADGCDRSVAIPVTQVGDLTIRHDFLQFAAVLSGACSHQTASTPADAQRVARLEGGGALAPRSAFQPRSDIRSSLAPWLLALALVTSIAEWIVRRRTRRNGIALTTNATSSEARAA